LGEAQSDGDTSSGRGRWRGKEKRRRPMSVFLVPRVRCGSLWNASVRPVVMVFVCDVAVMVARREFRKKRAGARAHF
jgi:hypothetical protein